MLFVRLPDRFSVGLSVSLFNNSRSLLFSINFSVNDTLVTARRRLKNSLAGAAHPIHHALCRRTLGRLSSEQGTHQVDA